MRYAIITLIVAAALLATEQLPAQAVNPYPEYRVIRDPAAIGSILYSKPDFGDETHYWLRYWNAPGFYAQDTVFEGTYTVSYMNLAGGKDSVVTRSLGLETVRVNQWDGISYDGQFLFRPNRGRSGRTYFLLQGINRYFKVDQVVDDPRLTNWWMSFAIDSAGSIWQAVERGALTKGFPGITQAIIDHMVAIGVVDPSRFHIMTAEQITATVVSYTNSALDYNVERVNEIIGEQALNERKWEQLQSGDRLTSYFWYRFGPYPEPSNVITLISRTGDIYEFQNSQGRQVSLSWMEISKESKFWKVESRSRRT